MRRARLAPFWIALALSATSTSVEACGDKLVPMGGGVRFETIAKLRFGNVLLYLRPGSQLHNADEELHLQAALRRAGHTVRVVHDRAELDSVLQQIQPDLVLMDWADASPYFAQLKQTPALPPVLPVVYESSTGEALRAGSNHDDCAVDKRRQKGRRVIQAVSELLKRRDKGLSVQCSLI